MNFETVISLFEELSYFSSIYHSRILALLISSPTQQSAKEIADRLNIPDSKVYPTLLDLAELELIQINDNSRPKQYYFDNPHSLQKLLTEKYQREITDKKEKIDQIVQYANQLWEPDEFTMGHVAQIFRGDEIIHELVRHLKLAKNKIFLLLAPQAKQYFDTLNQFIPEILAKKIRLDIALPQIDMARELQEKIQTYSDQVRIKESYWSQSSYIVRDEKVMMNLMHSQEDVALVTNDDLMVRNTKNCWFNDSCCSVKLIDLEIRN